MLLCLCYVVTHALCPSQILTPQYTTILSNRNGLTELWQNNILSAINNSFIFKYFMHKEMHLFNLFVHEEVISRDFKQHLEWNGYIDRK